MKKTIMLLIAITTIATIAFAYNDPVTPKELERSFHQNFPEATSIEWQKKNDLNIADFRKDGIRHFAYFDDNSVFLGVVRYITTDFMPFKMISELKKKYGDFGRVNAVEVSLAEGETFYFLNIIYKNKIKTVKSYLNGSSEILKNNL